MAGCFEIPAAKPVAPPCKCGAYFYSVNALKEHRCPLEFPIEIAFVPLDDLVNQPPHYKQGAVECIDAIEAALTPEEFRGYCKGNALKYTWREKHKGKDQDLAKAGWYLSRLSGAGA